MNERQKKGVLLLKNLLDCMEKKGDRYECREEILKFSDLIKNQRSGFDDFIDPSDLFEELNKFKDLEYKDRDKIKKIRIEFPLEKPQPQEENKFIKMYFNFVDKTVEFIKDKLK
jgi:hypothetical protein